MNNLVSADFKRACIGKVPTIKDAIPAFMTNEVILNALKKAHIDFLNSHCDLFGKVLAAKESLDLKTNKKLLVAINWLSLYDHLAKHLSIASKGQPMAYHPLNYYMLKKAELHSKDPAFQAVDATYKGMHKKIRAMLDKNEIDAGVIPTLKAEIAALK